MESQRGRERYADDMGAMRYAWGGACRRRAANVRVASKHAHATGKTTAGLVHSY